MFLLCIFPKKLEDHQLIIAGIYFWRKSKQMTSLSRAITLLIMDGFWWTFCGLIRTPFLVKQQFCIEITSFLKKDILLSLRTFVFNCSLSLCIRKHNKRWLYFTDHFFAVKGFFFMIFFFQIIKYILESIWILKSTQFFHCNMSLEPNFK